MDVRLLSAGDAALVVEFGDRIERGLSEAVVRLAERLRLAGVAGVVETVPTYRSLMVHYDPLRTSHEALEQALGGLLEDGGGAAAPGRRWRLPACYEAPHAPDLAQVAERTAMSTADVVRQHAGTEFHVYMLGFVPGYPYMGDLPEALVLPRRADPRVRVPPGSIAIASTMTAIYPVESPGGWHLIGATPVRLFDPARESPALLSPGDKVFFEPVGMARFDELRRASAAGDYLPDSERICP